MPAKKLSYENEGQRIAATLHTPRAKTKACVILVHGFSGDKDTEGSSDSFPVLAKALAERGFAVLRFDCRGSGESEGRFEETTLTREVSDLKRSIAFDKEQGFEHIGVTGASLGGAVALLGYDNSVECLALWFPGLFLMETRVGLFMNEH